jgi:hypothetical protein
LSGAATITLLLAVLAVFLLVLVLALLLFLLLARTDGRRGGSLVEARGELAEREEGELEDW